MKEYKANRRCPKCGYDGIDDKISFFGTMIKRHCIRCEYRWFEKPLYE